MAHEWYIQHAGKQYGPVTSAQLKKLAGDRKITPNTTVRLGKDGNWVPASRVQGLFPQPAAAKPAMPATPVMPAMPAIDPLAAPPVAPPPAPPKASPLARVPLGSVSAVGKPAAEEPPIAPKVVGAVGLIFGILALATFWLPMLKTPLGWTGIAVGGVGLLLGVTGLVLATLKKGTGLFINVAAASSSVVGLVLTVVLGLVFGMFSAPQPVVIAPPVVTPAPQPPPPMPEPEPEPEPEPPPQIVWTDASQAIEQGPVRIKIARVAIEKIRLENVDRSVLSTRGKLQPMLRVLVDIENISTDKIVEVPGWTGEGSGLTGQLGGLLEGSELGKTVQSATATATLVDHAGNNYKQTPESMLFGAQTLLGEAAAVRPSDRVQKQVVFPPPLDSIEYLRLELPPGGFAGSEPLRFQIPRDMVTGL